MYDPYTDDWKREVGMAAAGVLRAVTVVMPVLAGFAAAGLFLHFALSGPFEFTCKSSMKPKHRAEAMRLLPEPKIPAPALREAIKAEDE